MSIEAIVFFKTRPFGKYMYNIPSLEIKDTIQVSGTGPLGLLLFYLIFRKYTNNMLLFYKIYKTLY